MKKLFYFILVIASLSTYAVTNQPESVMVFKPAVKQAQPVTQANTLNSAIAESNTNQTSNLDKADNDSEDLLGWNRKIAIAKAKADYMKTTNPPASSSGGNNTGSSIAAANAQTTVSGVAVDSNGRKFATLLFTDGGQLDISVGSMVGDYSVSDITMTGVTLSKSLKKGSKPQVLHLHRVYSAQVLPKLQQQQNNNKSFFQQNQPTQVTTVSNFNQNDGTLVPPIITSR